MSVRAARAPAYFTRPARLKTSIAIAITIASNEPFSGWTKTFTDPRLCAAIVDRLTYDGTIIETGTTSYRLAHTRAAGGATSSRPGGAKSS